MADLKLAYGTAADVTITLAALPSDTSLLTGRESAFIDNAVSTAGHLDYLVSGRITTGTGPTTGRSIEVWAVGSWDGTNWPDVFDGTDSAETTSAEIKPSVCRFIAAIATTATADRAYHFGPVSLASAFGGTLPPRFVLFVTHSTGANLNGTAGNHQIRLQPVFQAIN
jgi:hypothetical protein